MPCKAKAKEMKKAASLSLSSFQRSLEHIFFVRRLPPHLLSSFPSSTSFSSGRHLPQTSPPHFLSNFPVNVYTTWRRRRKRKFFPRCLMSPPPFGEKGRAVALMYPLSLYTRRSVEDGGGRLAGNSTDGKEKVGGPVAPGALLQTLGGLFLRRRLVFEDLDSGKKVEGKSCLAHGQEMAPARIRRKPPTPLASFSVALRWLAESARSFFDGSPRPLERGRKS